MLLTIDVGNTRTNFGIYHKTNLDITFNSRTVKVDTASDLHNKLTGLLQASNLELKDIDGVSMSCVVPELSVAWKEVFADSQAKFIELTPSAINPFIPDLYDPDIDNPDEVAGDYIAALIAAKQLGDFPCVIFDFGTATNVAVLDKRGKFVGGVLMPGPETSLNALVGKASALDQITLTPPHHCIGKNTEECINSGIVIGEAARVEGLIAQIEIELGYEISVFVTGGFAPLISAYLKHNNYPAPNLILQGLYGFYCANCRG